MLKLRTERSEANCKMLLPSKDRCDFVMHHQAAPCMAGPDVALPDGLVGAYNI